MSTIKGQVYKIFSREFNGKMSYSVKLEDDPLYYRNGNDNPGNLAGKVIEFEAKKNPDGKSGTITSRITVIDTSSPAGPAPAVTGKTDWAKKDASIQYQSARKDALEMVKLLVSTGALKLPSKQAAQAEALEAAVDHYTSQYFEDIGTFGAVARANGVVETEDKPEASAEDDED